MFANCKKFGLHSDLGSRLRARLSLSGFGIVFFGLPSFFLVLRPLTLLIEAPERAAKHPGVLRRGCLAVGYI